jgi:hypothetical protein
MTSTHSQLDRLDHSRQVQHDGTQRRLGQRRQPATARMGKSSGQMRRSGSHGAREIRALRLRRSAATPAGRALCIRVRIGSDRGTSRCEGPSADARGLLRNVRRGDGKPRLGNGVHFVDGVSDQGAETLRVPGPSCGVSFSCRRPGRLGSFLRSFSLGRASAFGALARSAPGVSRCASASSPCSGTWRTRIDPPAGSFRGQWRECLLDTQTCATQALICRGAVSFRVVLGRALVP